MRFEQTLEMTYYANGFINVKVEYDKCIRGTSGPIEIELGAGGRILVGKVNREANMNRTARVMGGAKLRDWFHANFSPMDRVTIEIVSPERMVIHKDA